MIKLVLVFAVNVTAVLVFWLVTGATRSPFYGVMMWLHLVCTFGVIALDRRRP